MTQVKFTALLRVSAKQGSGVFGRVKLASIRTGPERSEGSAPISGSASEVLHVAVCPQPDIVGEVPTVVIGVEIDNDVVVIPEPVATVVVVVRRDLEVVAADVESTDAAAMKPPDMLRSNPRSEMSMFPRAIEVIVHIVAARGMSHPGIVGVYVRDIGVAGLIAVRAAANC